MRLALLLAAAVALALVYTQTQWLGPLKQKAIDIATPLYWLSNLPREMSAWSQQRLVPKEQLLQENEALRTELLIQQHRVQQMAAVVAENTRLRQLLNSADKLENRVLVAELIGVAPIYAAPYFGQPWPGGWRLYGPAGGGRSGFVGAGGGSGRELQLGDFNNRYQPRPTGADQPQRRPLGGRRARQPLPAGPAPCPNNFDIQRGRPAGQLGPRQAFPERLPGGGGGVHQAG